MVTPAFILGGGVNGLSVVRSLGRSSIPVYLFGADQKDIASFSRYAIVSEQSNVTNPHLVIKQLRKTAETLGCKPVLLYTSDYFLQLVSSHRDELKEFCEMNLPPPDVVETVIDKGKFSDFCTLHELPAPRTWVLGTQDQFDRCLELASFPVAIKPVISHTADPDIFRNGGVSVKMILAKNSTELTKYYSRLKGNGTKLLVQDYIEGADSEQYSYCSYRKPDCSELVGVGYRKIRLFPIHAGAGTFGEIFNDNELVDAAKKVIDKLHYRGVSSVSFKRNALTGRLMLHEVNGRFPMWHSASQLCDIDLPYMAYQDIVGAQVHAHNKHSGKGKWIALSLDIDSFRAYRNIREISTFQWLKSLLQVRSCAEYATDDLRPFVFLLKTMLRKVLRKAFGVAKSNVK